MCDSTVIVDGKPVADSENLSETLAHPPPKATIVTNVIDYDAGDEFYDEVTESLLKDGKAIMEALQEKKSGGRNGWKGFSQENEETV